MTKAISKDENVLNKLTRDGIKIGYIKHRIEKFIRKPKLIMCYSGR